MNPIHESLLQKLELEEARLKVKKADEAAKSEATSSSTSATPTESTEATSAANASAEASCEPSSPTSTSEVTTGADADTEVSVTSEEEEGDKADGSPKSDTKQEKWIAIKSQSAAAAAEPTPASKEDANNADADSS